MAKNMKKSRAEWVAWLNRYGAAKFFDAFVEIAQDAQSTCVQCKLPIYLDIVEGGGVPDWHTEGGDYGCGRSPFSNSEGTGGHEPKRQ